MPTKVDIVAGYNLDREIAWKRTAEATEAIRARGIEMQSIGVIRAHKHLLGIVRDLGDRELVLTRRGWVVAALMSKDRWLALHRVIENQGDALAAHRCPIAGTVLEPLPGWGRRTAHEVRLADEARATVSGLPDGLRAQLLRRLDELHGSAELIGSERLERRPHIRSLRLRAARLVWRIDGELVTVVRIVPLVAPPEAT